MQDRQASINLRKRRNSQRAQREAEKIDADCQRGDGRISDTKLRNDALYTGGNDSGRDIPTRYVNSSYWFYSTGLGAISHHHRKRRDNNDMAHAFLQRPIERVHGVVWAVPIK